MSEPDQQSHAISSSSQKQKIVEIDNVFSGKWLEFKIIKYIDKSGNLREWEVVDRAVKATAGTHVNLNDKDITDSNQSSSSSTGVETSSSSSSNSESNSSKKMKEDNSNQMIQKVDGVGVVAIKESDKKIVIIKQYRPPIGGYCLELPAGLVDRKYVTIPSDKQDENFKIHSSKNHHDDKNQIVQLVSETPEECATRELLEETGYKGKQLTKFNASGFPPLVIDCGMSSVKMNLVVMSIDDVNDESNKGTPKQHLESTEDIEVLLFPTSNLLQSLIDEIAKDEKIGKKTYFCSRLYHLAVGLMLSESL